MKVHVIFFSLLLFTFLKLIIEVDSDFGWHYRAGSYIVQKGIPSADPFSYTMPSYFYVYHSWLSDIFIFSVYSLSGIYGIAAFVTLFIFLTLRLSIDFSKPWAVILLFIGLFELLPFITTRPLVYSWGLFALLVKILCIPWEKNRLFKFLPLHFLIWANIHGSFLIGLLTLGVFVFFQKQTLKSFINRLFILLCSIVITLINPYGITLWKGIYWNIYNVTHTFYITEWKPITSTFYIPLLLYMGLTLGIMVLLRRKLPLFYTIVIVLLGFISGSNTRHTPYFIIAALPLWNIFFLYLQDVAVVYKFKFLLRSIYIVSLMICIYVFTLEITSSFSFSEPNFYPQKAIVYLQDNMPKGEIFADYNWGGYLQWKLPEKRVFIDGRMVEWEKQIRHANESQNAFSEYIRLIKNEIPLKETIDTYNITTIMLPKKRVEGSFLVKSQNATIYTNFLKEIENNNFTKVYADDNTEIYSLEK